MKIVFILGLLCIVTYCQGWGTRGGRQSFRRYQSSRNRLIYPITRLTSKRPYDVGKSRCVASGCCYDRMRNRCNCQAGSRSFYRGKRAAKIKVHLSLTNCICDGYEMGGHGGGPRPFRVVCTKASSSSSNRGHQKSNCSKKNQNDCTYNGNPHKCSIYNNNKQEKFYKELIDTIAPKQCGTLNLPNAPCPKGPFNTKKTCSEIDYN
ncbi:unnamed protein product [Mytilus coruscus]|uniref:Uncharacterized protein n=1 Tax=Mytilus coruscus TaxID=42192 RepID=A0A6J8ATP5_MYTCO|nr:unnamed protein product [Mytilus coruscus]